jgi:hypothetical protein
MTGHKASPHELHILGIKQQHNKPEQHAGIFFYRKYLNNVISQYGMTSNGYAVMSPNEVAVSSYLGVGLIHSGVS